MIPGSLIGASLPAGGSAGAAHTDPGAAADAGGAAPFHSYADALRAIAAVVDAGLAHPPIVSVDSYGQVVAHVRRADLPAWVIYLDMPAPDWTVVTHGDDTFHRASWPESVTDAQPFRLSCSEAVTA